MASNCVAFYRFWQLWQWHIRCIVHANLGWKQPQQVVRPIRHPQHIYSLEWTFFYPVVILAILTINLIMHWINIGWPLNSYNWLCNWFDMSKMKFDQQCSSRYFPNIYHKVGHIGKWWHNVNTFLQTFIKYVHWQWYPHFSQLFGERLLCGS